MLFKTLFSSHTKISSLILIIGLIIYILSELFEKIDTFIEVGTSFQTILLYFVYLTPNILSVILPAVCFLASIILLCLMAKNRELTALQAGGIAPFTLLKHLLIIAIGWAFIQILLSQYIGIASQTKSESIWDFEVRKRPVIDVPISNLWFVDDEWMINVESLYKSGNGKNFTAYHLLNDGKDIVEIISAKQVTVKDGTWHLSNGMRNIPTDFTVEQFDDFTMPFMRDHSLLFLTDNVANPQNLPLQHLSLAIDDLISSGSNVERLQIAFQMKLAYAVSIIVLTFVAFALLTWQENVYICVATGMLIAFLFYVSTMIFETLGQSGSLSPFMAAWTPHLFVIILSSLRIYYSNYRKN